MNPALAGKSGEAQIDVYPPASSDRHHPRLRHAKATQQHGSSSLSIDSPGAARSLKSVKSVDSVPVIGTYPLGSLRVNDPSISPSPSATSPLDEDPATPLTVPDLVMESPLGPPKVPPSRSLLKGGDVFILDDLPAKFTIGCDTLSFTTSQSFPGFRDIPTGAHLLWVAPTESTSSRSAYWIFTPEREEGVFGQVHVKQWDAFNEVLNDPANQAEERFQKERLEVTFDDLSPYAFRASASSANLLQSQLANAPTSTTPSPSPPPSSPAIITTTTSNQSSELTNTNIWFQLTFAIHPDLLNKITSKTQGPENWSWAMSTTDGVSGETNVLAEETRLYAGGATQQLRFSFPMDTHLVDPKAEGRERTRQALDPTEWILEKLHQVPADRPASSSPPPQPPTSEGHDDSRPEVDLVGELQFAFLTGMHLGNFSCLEQWWYYITDIIFRSHDLVTRRPGLARQAIQTFHAQLIYDDRFIEAGGGSGSVLETMPEQAKRLRRQLVTYKARLDERLLALGDRCTSEQQAVGLAFSSLEAWLWKANWDLRGDFVRSGNVMLEDGEFVQAELSDFEDEDERGEFAPVVVELQDDGRETG